MFEALFRQYHEVSQQRSRYILNNEYQDEWNVHRSCLYTYGVVLGKYRENDPLTMSILQSKFYTEDLYHVLKKYYSNNIKALIRTGKSDPITTGKIISDRQLLDDLNSLSIEKFINRHCDWLIKECESKGEGDIESVIKLAYLYFSYSLFESDENMLYNKNQQKINALFTSKGIKLPAYEKYELIPLDQDKEIILVDPPLIYDKSIDKTFFLQNVPLPLLTELKKLYEQKKFKQVSFRVKNNDVYDGRYDLGSLLEEVEFGKIFSLINLGEIKLTKLYSGSYDDCLWIKTDSNNITFEELCDDFEVYHEHIITQVVHLEYQCNKNKFYITHIDHEYIFYTLEEYTNRTKDADQKGNAASRIKTFKIDEAMIPLDYSLNVSWKDQNGMELPSSNILFLHFVLESYFKHNDLLHEYFRRL